MIITMKMKIWFFTKKLFVSVTVLILCLNSLECFALSADDGITVNLLTMQGKTGVVKEYSSLNAAIENANDGDIIEIIKDTVLSETITSCKSVVIASGEKRKSNIIIDEVFNISNCEPVSIDNIVLNTDGNGGIIVFKNIIVNGELITETGDLNKDYTVDLLDIINFKKLLSEKELRYHVSADINLDKNIDACDMAILKNMILSM